jgi:hypothetical protein
MRRAVCVVHMEEIKAYKIMVRQPGGKRPLEVSGCRWENNIRMNLREIRHEGVDLIYWAQDSDHW